MFLSKNDARIMRRHCETKKADPLCGRLDRQFPDLKTREKRQKK